jgi:hypothetical protein
MTTMKELNERREAVIKYVRTAMEAQGISKMQSIDITTRLYFVALEDINDLWKCINSGLDENIISAIVAHDVNGLIEDAPGFLPKARQFREAK